VSEHSQTILANARRAVWDVLADRGARTGRGYIRTSCYVVSGERRVIADAIAPFVPDSTTTANAEAVAMIVARRLATDETVKAKIAAATGRAGVTSTAGTAPGDAIRP
jgi:hypothetical protein